MPEQRNVLWFWLIHKAKLPTKVFTDEEVQRIQHLISNHVATSRSFQQTTIFNHFGTATVQQQSAQDVVPNLVERTVKNGANAGSQFLGCESYPRCRFTRDLPPVRSGAKNGSGIGGFILKIILVFGGIAGCFLDKSPIYLFLDDDAAMKFIKAPFPITKSLKWKYPFTGHISLSLSCLAVPPFLGLVSHWNICVCFNVHRKMDNRESTDQSTPRH